MTITASDLREKACKPCEEGMPALPQNEIDNLLQKLEGWEQIGQEIAKIYKFKNYYETMAFVNAIAWVSHKEGHHPDLEVSYSQCRVRYSTHAIGGLTENDFICAAKIEDVISAGH